MKESRNNLISGITFLLFGVFVFATSYMIQVTTSDILGSRFFPRATAVLIMILALVQISGAVKGMNRAKKEENPAAEEEKKHGPNKPLVLTVVSLFVYYILILYIGFTITSILYLLAQSAILMSKEDFKDKKKVLIMVAVAVIVPIFINTIFWNVFSIGLPAGKLF